MHALLGISLAGVLSIRERAATALGKMLEPVSLLIENRLRAVVRHANALALAVVATCVFGASYAPAQSTADASGSTPSQSEVDRDAAESVDGVDTDQEQPGPQAGAGAEAEAEDEDDERLVSGEAGQWNVSFDHGYGLEVTRDDNDFTFNLGGWLLLDVAKYFEDKNDLGGDTAAVRQAILEFDGDFTNRWSYRVTWGALSAGGQGDEGDLVVEDMFVEYQWAKRTVIIFGQQGEPFSLEEETEQFATTFMERALLNAFAPGDNAGLMINTYGDWWNFSGGAFFENLATSRDIGDQGRGFTGRASLFPINTAERVLHFGAALSYRDVSNEDQVLFRRRPESGVTDVRYVNTGDIADAEVIERFGLEAAAIYGPLSVQGEYVWSRVTREVFDDANFSGWYAFLSWFPTGESRKYLSPRGEFWFPNLRRGHGAVELAVRYSAIDLNSGSVRGGEEHNVTFGLNWYVDRNVRFMVNGILVETDIFANDNGDVLGNDSPEIFQMRFQYWF